jgi:DNA gyrase subunit B
VWFKPDHTIFTVLEYNLETLAARLRELSFLNKGLTITLTDERGKEPHVETFHAKDNFVNLLDRRPEEVAVELLDY